ncbi:IclR family transcriptional regulator [Sphingopyxis sp. YF1]|jgi:DNA-binding IclR family transcriptional regulator|nr:IclR family transcriptional regulator [Sphingopyxis sp. YF1]
MWGLPMARNDQTEAGQKEQRYRAPALDKGLDILELLAKERHPLTISMIGQRLGRSMSELFRMVQVLEYRGFIRQSESGEGFVPTDKLFALGMEQAPVKTMLEIALPVMRDLSATIGQSCHLAVRSGSDTVVVARIESAEQIGFTVRIGYRKCFVLTGSGAVLYAFQEARDQDRWLADVPPDIAPAQVEAFRSRAATVRKNGYGRAKSEFVVGVTDLSAPILRGTVAAAALSVPFVHSTPLVMPIDAAIGHLRASAEQISSSLLAADHRI